MVDRTWTSVTQARADVAKLFDPMRCPDFDTLLDATYVVCSAPSEARSRTADDGTLGRRTAWFWFEAADYLDQAMGFEASKLARSITSQFCLEPAVGLPDEFFLDVLILIGAGTATSDLELWWEMRELHLSRLLDIAVAASAAATWGVAALNECARAGLIGRDVERLLASGRLPRLGPYRRSHPCRGADELPSAEPVERAGLDQPVGRNQRWSTSSSLVSDPGAV